MASTINIINPCAHTNYSTHVSDSSHKVIVKLRYEAVYRRIYRQFIDHELSSVMYFPTASLTTMSSPFNHMCPECMADIAHDFESGVYGPHPDDTVHDTINHVIALLQQKVFHLADQLSHVTTTTILEGTVLITKFDDLPFDNIGQLEQAQFGPGQDDGPRPSPAHSPFDDIGQLEQAQFGPGQDDGPRPIPATEWAVEELERVNVDDGDVVADEDCAVCLDGLMSQQKEEVELIRMPCQHVFHESCIIEWLRKSHVCPLCRYELPVEDDYPSC